MVEILRKAGLDVGYALEIIPGSPDDAVWRRARDEGRLLLTEDRDCGELVVRLGHPALGLVYLRLGAMAFTEKAERVRTVVEHHADRLYGLHVVIGESQTRYRPLRRPNAI